MTAISRACRLAVCLLVIASGLRCAIEPEVQFRADELRTRFDLQTLGPIPYPPDNAQNLARIELGQLLFFDPILSGEKDVACSTCHHPNFAFTDRRQFSAGVSGRGLGPTRSISSSIITGHAVTETPRNSQTVLNAALIPDESGESSYRAPLFWDGRVSGLEEQALDPIASRVEMRGDAFPGSETEAAAVAVDSIISRLRNIPAYVSRFLIAFPEEAAALGGTPDSAIVDSSTLARSIAAYQRELVTPNSPFDRFVGGDGTALTDTQLDGLEIFFTTGKCAVCHGGPMLMSGRYLVTGVPSVGVGKSVIPGDDTGREEHTLRPADRYAFRAPSLRNVTLTPPYMHSGVFQTLEEVVRFYNDGANPRHNTVTDDQLDPAVQQPLGLKENEIAALVDFLHALTGYEDVRGQPLFSEPELVPSGLTDRYGTALDRVVMAGITSGSWHSCAISGVGSGVPNGTAYCWGRNDNGQLGIGTATSGDFRSNPQRVLNPTVGTGFEGEEGELIRFHRLAVGDDYSCGVVDGSLFCWGAEPIGRNNTRPALIEQAIDFRTIASGDHHVCGLDGAGIVYCMGDNSRGQLGDGTRVSTAMPIAIGGVTLTKLTTGSAHTCGLTGTGSAYCWGSNDFGQIGTGGATEDVLLPTAVVGQFTFAEISAGVDHTCGLTVNDEAVCWGRNNFGQLGSDTAVSHSLFPILVDGNLAFGTIAAGLNHTCAATFTKAVYCWGSNDLGQLGTDLPPGAIQVTPDSVHTDLAFRELSAGRYHTCSTNNELGFCWGGNQYGQVGNGGTNPNFVPRQVIGKP